MIKKLEYVCKCGLPVTVLRNDDFATIYGGIGTKFGGANLKYKYNGEVYEVIPGTAHFLEHKKFCLDNGKDAMETLSRYGECNAFTSPDKTVYFFENVIEYKESLKTLLEMYFTPVFSQKDIQKEKSIIINEYKDRFDDVFTQISLDAMKLLYPNDDFTKPLLGNIGNIKSINKDNLELAYHMFYTPKNSHLVLAGKIDDNIFEYIEEILANLSFSTANVEKLNYISSNSVLPPKTKYYDIYNESVVISFRMDELTNKNSIDLDKIGAVLDCLFMENCSFYKELYEEGLVDDSIDYYIDCHTFSTYVEIEALSSNPKKLAKKIISKIKSLSVEDVDKRIINQFIKYKKSHALEKEDNIRSLGAKCLSLSLEEDDYFEMLNTVMNLSYENIVEILDPLRRAQSTYLIAKPKK